MQFQVNNSPFNQEQVDLLNRLFPTLTETQQIWLGGYLSALQNTAPAAASADTAVLPLDLPAAAVTEAAPVEVTVLFGSQTGNCQEVATKVSGKLEEKGMKVTLVSTADFKPNKLKSLENLLVVISTQGEGDPPDTAIQFHEFLHGRRAPKLEALNYSVLALGDSSYEFFCETGKQFDERLAELGGKRIIDRMDCDLDYDEDAEEWLENVLNKLAASQEATPVPAAAEAAATIEAKVAAFSRTNPFEAEIYENLKMNGRGSNKETYHMELSLEGSNLEYEPGDSIGIYPENDPVIVDELIQETGWAPDELIPVNKKGDEVPLLEALQKTYEITVLTKPLLKKVAEFTQNPGLQLLLDQENDEAVKEYVYGRDLLDLIRDYKLKDLPAKEFIALLRKMPPRLYSVASSYKANPEEVHLTVGTVRYQTYGRERNGVCSVQCADRREPGQSLSIYVHKNPNFKLPADPDKPIIMIGPGTGIAPFRSFVEEREMMEAKGKSWLFFGDQHFVTDFLYQTDWQRWLKDGTLTKMDVAFSRDKAEKVYVQHRMLAQSKELFEWLQDGAVVYVCGDEKNMASDVHDTLVTILEREGNLNTEEAHRYLAEMQQEKRYQRDVY
ncbi:assimilatory sulfite reductase (NADPH) flavoprotein subunit [Oceanobacillus jeddahense]|uniref:Assimilatory sulfite reductase (NADPH) flavoprotein subunit n=1 Tax=Oceanobacillus jeddahense TaxID=1462527 RepID=A0ABY5JNU0_9BACI|nr:assimilatory sulfite reductase (NADPH) flavoprotein subunit [Oceanobacillus jeddahense]UUI01965.1 assimilatory sulfite reductase (NADPH) flavoprotein subunit [Oceanobacillus jeddahense]